MENEALEPEKQIYPFEQFEADVEKIAQIIKASGRKFTHIHTLPRGGWPLATWLGNRLNLKAIDVGSGLAIWGGMICTIPEIKRTEVLVVDDIADTGKQLQPYRDAGFFIATLFYKKWSTVVPDIWINEKFEKWVKFPWEKEELIYDHIDNGIMHRYCTKDRLYDPATADPKDFWTHKNVVDMHPELDSPIAFYKCLNCGKEIEMDMRDYI